MIRRFFNIYTTLNNIHARQMLKKRLIICVFFVMVINEFYVQETGASQERHILKAPPAPVSSRWPSSVIRDPSVPLLVCTKPIVALAWLEGIWTISEENTVIQTVHSLLKFLLQCTIFRISTIVKNAISIKQYTTSNFTRPNTHSKVH